MSHPMYRRFSRSCALHRCWCKSDDVEDCDEAGNSGKCKPGKPKTGCSDDVWITPGIQLVAIKAAPANPLVYNQDPDKTECVSNGSSLSNQPH